MPAIPRWHGVVVVYGTWTPIHAETGKQVFNKWHGILEFNEAGKITSVNEFWNPGGIQVQLEATHDHDDDDHDMTMMNLNSQHLNNTLK